MAMLSECRSSLIVAFIGVLASSATLLTMGGVAWFSSSYALLSTHDGAPLDCAICVICIHALVVVLFS